MTGYEINVVSELLPGGKSKSCCKFDSALNSSVYLAPLIDVKGLYWKARAGDIAEFRGISSLYEALFATELVLSAGTSEINVCVRQVVEKIAQSVALT